VIQRVPAVELRKTFDEIELTLDVASGICLHCGALNLFPGFSKMKALTCNYCGEFTRLSDDPDVGRRKYVNGGRTPFEEPEPGEMACRYAGKAIHNSFQRFRAL